jgi:hypothetical protein
VLLGGWLYTLSLELLSVYLLLVLALSVLHYGYGWIISQESTMSKSEQGYSQEARWLLSDGAIMGKIQKGKGANGSVRLTLPMPYNEDLVVDVAKLNAASMSQFCDMARREYDERKAEQEAKALRKASMRDAGPGESGGGAARREEDVQGSQETVGFDPLDYQSVSNRLASLTAREEELSLELAQVVTDRLKLTKILEILDAPTDDEEELCSVPEEESGEQELGVDRESCPREVLSDGEG